MSLTVNTARRLENIVIYSGLSTVLSSSGELKTARRLALKLNIMDQANEQFNANSSTHRRDFVKKGLIVTLTGVSAIGLLSGCKENEESDDDEGQKVSPPEDLMQEHGLLNRVLLIYDTCRTQLMNKTSVPKETLSNAANVIRTFVEDYHEKQEEQYLFPRFQKAQQLTDLVHILLQQHQAGRRITDEIMQLTKSQTTTDAENQRLVQLLTAFNTMYRPHEAREDTVLFPAFRKIVSKHEYDSLGEDFEKNEQKRFGKDGFAAMVSKVAMIEKSLGIYELAEFTPTT